MWYEHSGNSEKGSVTSDLGEMRKVFNLKFLKRQAYQHL